MVAQFRETLVAFGTRINVLHIKRESKGKEQRSSLAAKLLD